MSPSGVVHLVLGASGQVGSELVTALASSGTVLGLKRPELDLCRHDALPGLIRRHQPRVVWNAAAATAVDALEQDPALAFAVNAEAPRIIAEECRRLDAVLVHFSTDYVFDGRKHGPYVEDDPTGPLNVYGRSKLEGEHGVRGAGGRHLIFRTSWVYGPAGRNFVRAMFARRSNGAVRVVDDQFGAPTWSRSLAIACSSLHGRLLSGTEESGTYHLTASGSTSWFGLAERIRDVLRARGVTWTAPIERVSAVDYAAPARRPANSVLNNDKVHRSLGIALPDWDDSLQAALADPAMLTIAPGATL